MTKSKKSEEERETTASAPTPPPTPSETTNPVPKKLAATKPTPKKLAAVAYVGPNIGGEVMLTKDTIYKDGIPQLVFEWRGAPDSETEHYLVPLDPAFLHPLPGWKGVDYMYERPITDPRQHN